MSESCLFCRIIAGEIPSDRVHDDDHLIAFRDINPAAPTHVLVVPREHIATLDELEERHAELMGRMFLAAKGIAAAEGLGGSGWRAVMNCGAGAGQSVFHIHLHVLGGRGLSWPPG